MNTPGRVPEGKYTKVRTIIMRTNEHIPVDYMLEHKGHKWMIGDVIIDGVSTVETYQNSFDRFLRDHSFDVLIQRMAIQKRAGEESSMNQATFTCISKDWLPVGFFPPVVHP